MMEEQTKNLEEYWKLILKYKWLILACMALVVIPTVILLMNARPIYRATARILIEQRSPNVVQVKEVSPSRPDTRDYFESQLDVLRSSSLVRRVIRALKLNEDSAFAKELEPNSSIVRFINPISSLIRKFFSKQERSIDASTDDPLYPYLQTYYDRLRILSRRGSRVVGISFESFDPALAARIANEHARAHIDANLRMKLSASDEASKWLQVKLEEAQKKLRDSEEKLQRFQEEENIVYLASISADDEKRQENVIANKLSEIGMALETARTERISLETLHNQLVQLSRKPGMIEALPQVIDNPLVQTLKQQYTELLRQQQELKEKYGARHPRMVGLRDEIRGLKERIRNEVGKIAKSLEIKLNVAKSKERGLAAALEKTKDESIDLSKKAIQFSILKHEVESNRQIYEMLLRRVNETSLTSGLTSTNLVLLDKASIPQEPVKPKKMMIILMALAAGLSLGVGLTFFVDYLDRTFHGTDEVKKHLGVTFLGPVSSIPGRVYANGDELWVLQEPRSQFAECLRNVRTNLIFTLGQGQLKSVVVTSTDPAEGKTLIASNLAVLLAQMGQRVLLIDADMRKPRVHKVFGVDVEPGLSNMLLHKRPLPRAMRNTPIRELKVIPAGTIPPNPAEMLASGIMRRLIARFRSQFDIIIFDSPPILSATDSSMLGGMVDGTVMVVRASKTKRANAKIALGHLNDAGARVMGAILNQVDFKRERYYYGYYSNYYTYYAKDGTRRRRKRKSGEMRHPVSPHAMRTETQKRL